MTIDSSLPLADVFVLTFNAQKQIINVPVFAKHLLDVFRGDGGAAAAAATGVAGGALPDLVVFSLQEMAPLAKAFAGSTMLGEYFDAYGEALNRAAARFVADDDDASDGGSSSSAAAAAGVVKKPFSLIANRSVGMTASMLFARDATAVSNVRAAEVGFGAGDMANKGAVGLRVLYTDGEGTKKGGLGTPRKSTELTFVTTHLAAMEWNLSKRNKNWESLVSGLVFDDPKKYVDRAAAQSRDRGAASAQGAGRSDEAEGLLSEDRSEMEKAMHNLSIYKPGSHLFVSGDLNYRISSTSPEDDAIFPSTDPSSPDHYPRFLELDQLTKERRAGRTMHGLSEARISFPPTYKLKVLPKAEGNGADQATANDGSGFEEDNVAWKWAPHRWPGWCDRVLYREIPQGTMQVVDYNCLPPIRTSDHRPVYLRIQVPVMEPEQLSQIPDAIEDESGVVDTRKKLPFEIDVDSWRHRASIKKLESTLGYSLLVAQSKQAMAVLATLLVLGAGAWWYLAVSSVV